MELSLTNASIGSCLTLHSTVKCDASLMSEDVSFSTIGGNRCSQYLYQHSYLL